MKDRYLFAIAAALVFIMAFFFFKSKKRPKVLETEDVEIEEEIVNQTPTAAAGQNTIRLSSDASVAKVSSPTPTTGVNPVLFRNFAEHMKEVAKCLQLKDLSPGDQVDPTPDNLISMLRPNLGEVIIQIDDWSQFDIIEKNGTKKRIRVDFDYPDGVTPNRRLSSYTYNSYGSLEIDNLTADQTDNPNEAYIESLKEGSQVNLEERAARVYFSQGEEVSFTIKNGKLDTFNISRSEYAINCTGLSEENSKCSCP
jgi:hypothetical protein